MKTHKYYNQPTRYRVACVEDMMYEIAEEVAASYSNPSAFLLSLFNRIAKIVYEAGTEERLIEMTANDPLKGVEIANMILTAASISNKNGTHVLEQGIQAIADLAYKLLLTAYVSLKLKSPHGEKDLLVKMLDSMAKQVYTTSFIEEVEQRCRGKEGSELAKCIIEALNEDERNEEVSTDEEDGADIEYY